ncbi:MAG: LemA family protein, partial [Candidatus Omnitrophica bacterium]|nr:LemA family protein [Candidatus Omnitrophota bacterium]
DLVPNLVATVKGYAAHEKETLQGVVDARAKISQMNVSSDVVNSPQAMEQFQQMQGALSSALSRLMVVVERYPDLKASQNFLALQTQLEGTENRITVERRRFNEAARVFNTFRRQFPNVIIANMMGFASKAYFEADAGAAKAPQVEF